MTKSIPTPILGLLFVIIVLISGASIGCKSQAQDRSQDGIQGVRVIACTPKVYDASAPVEEKKAVLNGLLTSPTPECYVVFYTLLESATEQDLPLFQEAYESHPSCESVEGMLAYLMRGVAQELKDAKVIADRIKGDAGALTDEDREKGKRIVIEIANKVNANASFVGRRLGDERIEGVVRKNASCVAKKLYAHKFPTEHSPEDYVLAQMLTSVIVNIGEPGLTALLDLGLETEEEQLFLAELIKSFDANAVFPLLRHYEKTESKKEADICFTLILMLPDTESVYQRVIDAMEQGPFFPKEDEAETVEITTEERAREPAKKGVRRTSVTEALEKMSWQIILRYKYKGKKAFAQYAATHMSKYPDVMMSALLIAADARVALEYYVDVRPADLQKFVFIGVDGDLITPKDVYIPLLDRIRLLERWFDQLPASEEEKRMTLLLSALDFPRTYQMIFVDKRFRTLTPKEQQHVIVTFCRYPWEETKGFLTEHFRDLLPKHRSYVIHSIHEYPRETAKEAYRAIRPLCTDKEQSDMDFLLKHYGITL